MKQILHLFGTAALLVGNRNNPQVLASQNSDKLNNENDESKLVPNPAFVNQINNPVTSQIASNIDGADVAELKKSKQFENSLTRNAKAIELEPENHMFLLQRARIYFEMGLAEEGLKNINESIKIFDLRKAKNPSNFAKENAEHKASKISDTYFFPYVANLGYLMRAQLYLTQGKNEEALLDLEEMAKNLDHSPYYPKRGSKEIYHIFTKSHYYRALEEVHDNLGNIEAAQEAFVELAKQRPDIYSDRRESVRNCHDDDESKHSQHFINFGKLLKANPADQFLHFDRAKLFYKRGEYEKAIKDFDEAEKRMEDVEYIMDNFRNKLRCYVALSRHDDALEDTNRLLTSDHKIPEDEILYLKYIKIDLLDLTGNHEEVLEVISTMKQVDGKSNLKRLRHVNLLKMGKEDEVLKEIATIYEPDTKDYFSELKWLYTMVKEKDKAALYHEKSEAFKKKEPLIFSQQIKWYQEHPIATICTALTGLMISFAIIKINEQRLHQLGANPLNFYEPEIYTKAIEGFAKNIAEFQIDFESLTSQQKEALLLMSLNKADEVIDNLKNTTHSGSYDFEFDENRKVTAANLELFLSDKNDDVIKHQKFALEVSNEIGNDNKTQIDFIKNSQNHIDDKIKEFLTSYIQDSLLADIADVAVKEDLKEILYIFAQTIHEYSKVRTTRLPDGREAEENAVYKQSLKADVTLPTTLDKEKLNEFLTIFREGLGSYYKELHSLVFDENSKKEIGEILKDLVTKVEKNSEENSFASLSSSTSTPKDSVADVRNVSSLASQNQSGTSL